MKIVAGAGRQQATIFFCERRCDYEAMGASVLFVTELEGHKPGVSAYAE